MSFNFFGENYPEYVGLESEDKNTLIYLVENIPKMNIPSKQNQNK